MNILRPAIALTLVFVVLTGFLFPAAIWAVGQAVFPHQANGSLIRGPKGSVVGSELIGQNFTGAGYFHPRPSAAGAGYDAANSGGTNLGPTSDKLINGIKDDPATKDVNESFAGIKDLASAYRKENGLQEDVKVPADAATRSGSGLDPEISLANAMLQAPRIAKARGIPQDQVLKIVTEISCNRFMGLYGEARLNVLKANIALDHLRSL